MTEIVISAEDFDSIRNLAFQEVEGCAVLFASQTTTTKGATRLLVREVEFPEPADYTRRSSIEAELKPDFVARTTKRARGTESALIFVHSHLTDEAPLFSPIDSMGEQRLAKFLAFRHPGPTHAALVVSKGGARARLLGEPEDLRIVALGERRDVPFDPNSWIEVASSDLFDRQVRALGSAGQQALQTLRVAIVGLGGIGSLVAQQLVYLGVRRYILLDNDTLVLSNLNRVVGATYSDVDESKVSIAQRYLLTVHEDCEIDTVRGDVMRSTIARTLLDADFILGCTDSHGSRAVIQQIAYQHMIPCIDTGTTIDVVDGRVKYIYGRVQMLAPGLACLTCGRLLHSEEIRRDMMSGFERQADPYVRGEHIPSPAVISINGTVASLAVTMLLSAVSGMPSSGRHLLYNAVTSSLRTVRVEPETDCYVCSRSGAFGRGDSWPLFARQD
jgi:molybdopterin/thiamine biosynthesis adenylyltransferase